MIGKINHIAIAVPNIIAAAATYKNILGAHVSDPHCLPEQGVTIVFVTLPNNKIELMEPLGKDSPITNYLRKNPAGGLHHVCFEVEDIHVACNSLREKGACVLGNGHPKIGAHGKPVLFLHPKDFHGTLIELEEA